MPSFALGKELSGLKGLLGRAGYGAGVFTAPSWMFGLFNQGQSSSATSAAINRAAQIVPGLSPNPRTDLGRQLGSELQYIGGQLMQGRNPYAKPAVGNIPPSANGESYRRAELRLADAARPGGGGGGGGNAGYSVAPFSSPAAERAYQSDKAAVAQQVAQDPALSQYERDRAAAVASGDQAKMDAVRDQGMAIWAAKYGGTPMGQPGGAVGMDNRLMQRTFGYQTGSAPDQQMGSPTLGPSPLVPQVDPTLNPAGPNYLGGEGPPLMNFADPRFENMSPEEFQKLLNQINKK